MKMAAATDRQELAENLAQHQAQLEQVEAALTNDPGNEELLKLKKDLEDVISITTDLLEMSAPPEKSGNQKQEQGEAKSMKQWKIGDLCMAIWSGDGRYYEVLIETFSEDQTTCSVVFPSHNVSEIVKVADLREFGAMYTQDGEEEAQQNDLLQRKRPPPGQTKAAKLMKAEQRELKKKKQQKKLLKQQEAEQVREKDKKRWQDFVNKSGKKGTNLSSKPKRSIFAVPDSIHGKVGVGTNNIGGKGMTEYVTPKGYAKPQ